MGLFAKLFSALSVGSTEPIASARANGRPVDYVNPKGQSVLAYTESKAGPFWQDIVGESHHVVALRSIVGPYPGDEVNVVEPADLVMEIGNPYDPNAVAVWIQGKAVGHLNCNDAKRYRAGKYPGQCKALIRAFPLEEGGAGYTVVLDLLI